MSSITADIRGLSDYAEKIRNDAPAHIGTMSVGDNVRQGDIYITRLAKRPAWLKPLTTKQLAPGTTQGSRHCVAGDYEMFEALDKAAIAGELNRLVKGADVRPELVGPVFVARGEVTVEHPEHGHRSLPADGVCVVTYQRAFAEEVRRVLD